MAKQAECRRKIWDASGFLLELVNEVLDMGKLESGEVVLEHRPFNMVKLLTGLQDVLEKQAAGRGIRILCDDIDLPQPDPRKAADDEHYEQRRQVQQGQRHHHYDPAGGTLRRQDRLGQVHLRRHRHRHERGIPEAHL